MANVASLLTGVARTPSFSDLYSPLSTSLKKICPGQSFSSVKHAKWKTKQVYMDSTEATKRNKAKVQKSSSNHNVRKHFFLLEPNMQRSAHSLATEGKIYF